MGIILHAVDARMEPIKLVLYCDKLGTNKTADNQATRIKHIFSSRFGVRVEQVVWAISSDNAGDSANIATKLGLQTVRCGAHVLALGPGHQFYEVERVKVVDGEKTRVKQMHEDAVEECFKVVERVRRIHFLLRDKEEGRLLLEQVQKPSGQNLRATGDTKAKWKGVLAMLERHWVIRADVAEVAVRKPSLLAGAGGPLSHDELRLVRDIHALLTPWAEATDLLQSEDGVWFAASAYLPVMKTVQGYMETKTEFLALGAVKGSDLEVVKLGDLHPAAQRLRDSLSLELRKNWRHIEPCELVLRKMAAMDPRFKLSIFPPESRSAVQGALEAMVDLWDSDVAVAPAEKKQRASRKDFVEQMRATLRGGSPAAADGSVSKARLQLRAFLESEPINIEMAPLDWWKEQKRDDVNCLLPLVRRLFAVPGSNGAVERLFSTTRRLFEHLRAGMASATVEKCIFLKYNMEELGMWKRNCNSEPSEE